MEEIAKRTDKLKPLKSVKKRSDAKKKPAISSANSDQSVMVINEIKNRLKCCDDCNHSEELVVSTTDRSDINDDKKYSLIINLESVNNIRRINKFHETINSNLIKGGFYVSCCTPFNIKKNESPGFFKKLTSAIDFIYRRLFSKLPVLKKVYFFLSGGRNRALSETEALGRLISCGFEIRKTFVLKNALHVITKKIKDPDYNMSPSYGPLYKMERIGKNGKMIKIYKIRTMYSYSEYLEEYLYKANMLNKNGDKILNDPRIPNWGRFLRRFWIDELPQIFNLLKGDISLVGVRALSRAKYDLYDEEFKRERIKFKPGLIPPFYADLPQNFTEFQLSEKEYLKKKQKAPFSTDLSYLIKALYNILFKRARSS